MLGSEILATMGFSGGGSRLGCIGGVEESLLEVTVWPVTASVRRTDNPNFNENNLPNRKETTIRDCFFGHNEAVLWWWSAK